MDKEQIVTLDDGSLNGSNNRNEAGRDVINKYGDENNIDKELQAS